MGSPREYVTCSSINAAYNPTPSYNNVHVFHKRLPNSSSAYPQHTITIPSPITLNIMANVSNILRVIEEFVDEHEQEACPRAAVESHTSAALNNLLNNGNDNSAAHAMGASQGANSRADKFPSDVRPYIMMTRTCYIDFDPMNPRAKLPGVFARAVNPLIGNTVILQDINHNQIQVSVERKVAKVYLVEGWSRLRDFYGILTGGWITLTYITPFMFHIRVRKITGIEVTYPRTNPPCRLMLPKPVGEGSSVQPIPLFVMPTLFTHKLEKTLSSSDVQTGSLVLFWRGFCQYALPSHETDLTFIDWRGYSWNKCPLQFENTTQMTCKISGQWSSIVKAHRLTEGVTIKLGVTEASNNTTIYFKIAPFIGVRTTMYATTTSRKRKIFYESQHHFML